MMYLAVDWNVPVHDIWVEKKTLNKISTVS